MYLKNLSNIQNTRFILTHCMEMQHNGVTLKLRTKRINCVRTQSLSVVFKNATGETVETPPVALTAFTEHVYVSHYTTFRQAVLAWIKHPDTVIPVQVELALRAIINRDEYIAPLSSKLRGAIDATKHRCEGVRGVSISAQRSALVFPTTGGYHVRVDVRIKRKRYTVYFSVTHPDHTRRNEQGGEIAVIFSETRYGYVLGARGFYTLIGHWCKTSTMPNVSMLKAAAPELLTLINGERKQMVDDFFNIINSQVSTHVSVP